MNLVVDANVIFSAIIRESRTHEILFSELMHPFTPEFFLTELEEHAKEIQKKTDKTEEEFAQLASVLKKKLIFVPLQELLPYLDEAERICPDPDDVAYFALALKLKCPIWSQDKALKEQKAVPVYSTEELMKIFS
ncbi:MAG: PIN domain-containing protein [Candidatus Woesearchaeota archaeon]